MKTRPLVKPYFPLPLVRVMGGDLWTTALLALCRRTSWRHTTYESWRKPVRHIQPSSLSSTPSQHTPLQVKNRTLNKYLAWLDLAAEVKFNKSTFQFHKFSHAGFNNAIKPLTLFCGKNGWYELTQLYKTTKRGVFYLLFAIVTYTIDKGAPIWPVISALIKPRT